jgi:rhomboid family GlyGly-CTERM serine protease
MKAFRPVLLCVLPAVLLAFVPAGRDLLLYDRSAILQGEWWRLWTGHWMHFSFSHLAWNLVVLLGAGAWLERLQPNRLPGFLLLVAPLISVILLIGEPGMQSYGGLSGLAVGVVVLLALTQRANRHAGAARTGWGVLLAIVALKLIVEAAQAAPLFAGFGTSTVRPSTLAHAAGAVMALLFFLSARSAAAWRINRRSATGGSPR